jgi:hypothetical protein
VLRIIAVSSTDLDVCTYEGLAINLACPPAETWAPALQNGLRLFTDKLSDTKVAADLKTPLLFKLMPPRFRPSEKGKGRIKAVKSGQLWQNSKLGNSSRFSPETALES